MKIIKNDSITERRLLKILGIILCIIISYVMFQHVNNELYTQRYEGIFVGFIEMYLNKHISLNYFSPAPLFSSGVQIDPLVSTIAKHIMVTESFIPNFVMLFLTLHYITGLSPQLLVVLPLGVLFVPIAYLAVIKAYVPVKDGSNLIFQFLLATYIVIYLMATRWYGSFYGGPPAYLLLLILFLCIKRFYEKDNKSSSYYLIICLSMLSLAHYWHSILMMAVFFIMSLWIVSGLFYLSAIIAIKFVDIKERTSAKIIFSRSTLLFIISLILSLTFMHLWSTSYFGEFFRTAGLFDFLSNAATKLFGGNPFPVPYAFSYKDLFWGKIYFNSLLLIYVLATLILIIPVLLNILQAIRKKTIDIKLPLIFTLSILLGQIINAIAYYKSNSLAFPQVALFFPMFGVYLFISTVSNKKEKLRKIIISSLSIMIMLSLMCNISMYLTNEAGTTSVTKYADTKGSFEWLYHNIDRDKSVIADFNVLGKYLQRESKISKPSIEYKYITPDSYSVLVGDNEVIPKYLTKNYAVVDHATMAKGLPIHSNTARALLKPELEQINNCSNQDKIYEDSYISTFMFK